MDGIDSLRADEDVDIVFEVSPQCFSGLRLRCNRNNVPFGGKVAKYLAYSWTTSGQL